jgi:F420-non-reducing hydrogenase large subunit
MHHLASNKAVDGCFGVTPTPAGHKLRELMQTIAHAEDKLLHFFFLAAADFVIGPTADYAVRNVIGIAQANPELAVQGGQDPPDGQDDAGQIFAQNHPPGGRRHRRLRQAAAGRRARGHAAKMREILDFALFTIDFAKKDVFPKYMDAIQTLGVITTGFIGTVDDEGALNLYDGKLRMMKADGSYTDFAAAIMWITSANTSSLIPTANSPMPVSGTKASPWTWSSPKAFTAPIHWRASTWPTRWPPRAHRPNWKSSGSCSAGRPRPPLLYHYARLIEEVYACERAIEILQDPDITDPNVRAKVTPKAGRGVGCVEAPRGTLIHDYTTDENGLISQCQHDRGHHPQPGPHEHERQSGRPQPDQGWAGDEGILNQIEMAVRAYDP